MHAHGSAIAIEQACGLLQARSNADVALGHRAPALPGGAGAVHVRALEEEEAVTGAATLRTGLALGHSSWRRPRAGKGRRGSAAQWPSCCHWQCCRCVAVQATAQICLRKPRLPVADMDRYWLGVPANECRHGHGLA